MSSNNITGIYLVPGLPHILTKKSTKAYDSLRQGYASARNEIAASRAERIIYYSTSWLSVLGHMFQAKSDLTGLHVDENWYDECDDLDFSFRVDRPLAERMSVAAKDAGYGTYLVDYEGFPVDTATIVANRLLNPGGLPVGMVSCSVYSDGPDTERLATVLRRVIEDDGRPTAVVGISLLSGRYYTRPIDLADDRVSTPEDDRWNQRVLSLMAQPGSSAEVKKLIPEYAAATKADMGLKTYYFLSGIAGGSLSEGARCLGYGGLYGTGGAVIAFS